PRPPRATLFPYTPLFRSLAAKLLRESKELVSRIAGRVGYISETAFAKAFRRKRNVAPGQYRYGKLREAKLSRRTVAQRPTIAIRDRKSTRLNSSHVKISY